MIAIGHSSGGHFALWLAARAKLPRTSDLHTPDPLHLSGAVNLDGPVDLKATIPVQQAVCGSPVVTELIGGPPEQFAERYHAASPIELLPFGVPQVHFTGAMPGAQMETYEAAAKTAGDEIRSTRSRSVGHFGFVDPKSDIWPQVLAAVHQLLRVPQ